MVGARPPRLTFLLGTTYYPLHGVMIMLLLLNHCCTPSFFVIQSKSIYFGNAAWHGNRGHGTGPWVGADLEAGMYVVLSLSFVSSLCMYFAARSSHFCCCCCCCCC